MAGAYAPDRKDARNAWLSQFPFELMDGGLGISLALTTTSGTSSRTALPVYPAAVGEQVLIHNYGSYPCHLRFGDSSVVATTSCLVILPNLPYTLTIPEDASHVAGMVAGGSGTTTVQICRGFGN